MSEPTHFSDLQIIETEVSRNRTFYATFHATTSKPSLWTLQKNPTLKFISTPCSKASKPRKSIKAFWSVSCQVSGHLESNSVRKKTKIERKHMKKNGSTTLQVTNKERNTSLSTDWKWHENRIEAHPKESQFTNSHLNISSPLLSSLAYQSRYHIYWWIDFPKLPGLEYQQSTVVMCFMYCQSGCDTNTLKDEQWLNIFMSIRFDILMVPKGREPLTFLDRATVNLLLGLTAFG